MTVNEEKIMRACLRQIKGLGSQRLKALITYFGDATSAWKAKEREYASWGNQKWIGEFLRQRKLLDPETVESRLRQLEINLTTPEEETYPQLLSQLTDAPPLLYYKGTIEGKAEAVAIVGARKSTPYGRAVAQQMAEQLALQGIVVVSGLALGIDRAAHCGVLKRQGVTWAFLGCGLDRIYPNENIKLAAEVKEQGALISEYPPGTPPEAGHFPARNRLISGCSRGVVVVEAAERSGALITADFALEQGREVFAVPGSIFSPQSKGTHHLLRQGAKLVESIEDIWPEISPWAAFWPFREELKNKQRRPEQNDIGNGDEESKTDAIQKNVLSLLGDSPLHFDQIQVQSIGKQGEVTLALLELELGGKIVCLPGGYYVLNR